MASRGFEFAYNLDGSNTPPRVMDWPVNGTGAYAIGDLCGITTDGQATRVTGTTTEVFCVIQEARASGTDGANLKVAIIERRQVWRCSMDAATTAAVIGYTKTLDTTDHNTIDADDLTNGAMIPVDVSQLDDDGNVLAYVVFADTTFGNT